MLTRLFPLIFILLWSSAFVSSKFIVEEAAPFIALCFRFIVVAVGYALFAVYCRDKLRVPLREAGKAMGTGALFHGVYLGGVFYSISQGMPAGLAALIVTLQPILTAALARPLLGEIVTARQWTGTMLGFAGVAVVLGVDLSGDLTAAAYWSVALALCAITAGTLWQKKISYNLPLSVNNMYQALSATIFHAVLFMALEPSAHINFSGKFILAMSWQIFFVSFGAFTILMYLLKKGDASKTATLFFLVPGMSVIMAWLAANETLSVASVVGLIISSIGVYIATRPRNGRG